MQTTEEKQKPLVDRLLDSADYHDNGGAAELQMSDEGALLREAAAEIERLRDHLEAIKVITAYSVSDSQAAEKAHHVAEDALNGAPYKPL